MAEITCPNCGTVISLEQSEIESVAKQVRDEEFHRELDERIRLIEAEKVQALKLVESESAATLKQAKTESDAALKQSRIEAQAALDRQKAESEADLQKAVAKRDAEIAELRAQIEAQKQAQQTEQQLAVAEAVAAVEIVGSTAQGSLARCNRNVLEEGLGAGIGPAGVGMVVVHWCLSGGTKEGDRGLPGRDLYPAQEVGDGRPSHGSRMEAVKHRPAVGQVTLDGEGTAGHYHDHDRLAGGLHRRDESALCPLQVKA